MLTKWMVIQVVHFDNKRISAMHSEHHQHIQDLRDHHIGRLLLQAQRAFNGQAIRKLRDRGYDGLGTSHVAILPHIDLDGTRISTLASRAEISKQAAGQIVDDLERQGLVTRTPDPSDRRASLVQFTASGWDYLDAAHAVKLELETEYRTLLGDDRFEVLKTALAALIDHHREA
jgi:DNA-binding MarR family transcriptional regulator